MQIQFCHCFSHGITPSCILIRGCSKFPHSADAFSTPNHRYRSTWKQPFLTVISTIKSNGAGSVANLSFQRRLNFPTDSILFASFLLLITIYNVVQNIFHREYTYMCPIIQKNYQENKYWYNNYWTSVLQIIMVGKIRWTKSQRCRWLSGKD